MALSEHMLREHAWVKISRIRTIPIDRLGKRIVGLDPEMPDQLVDGCSN